MREMISFVVALCSLLQITTASRCCAPKQFEAVEGFMIGMDGGHLNGGQGKLSYDAKNKKIAYRIFGSADGQAYNVTRVLDFQKKIQYLVTNGNCVTTKLTTNFQEMCVPDNATLARSSYFGAQGDSLAYTAYTVTVSSEGRVGNMYLSVTNKECIVVGGTQTGTYNGKTGFMMTFGYSGTTIGIKYPSVFDKPKSCSDKPKKGKNFLSFKPHHIHLNSKNVWFF